MIKLFSRESLDQQDDEIDRELRRCRLIASSELKYLLSQAQRC
jgi:hypothetical protein